MVTQQGSVCGIKCTSLPKMNKDCIYKLEVDIKTTGSDVCHAQCNCPAGRGPHGSCKHIAATLFALENFYSTCEEIKASNDDDVSCTSKLQTWNQPRKRRLECKCSSEITFRVEDYYHKPCRQSKEPLDPRPLESQKITDTEMEAVLGNLKELKLSCGFLDLMVPAEQCKDTTLKFPSTLTSAQAKISAHIIKECPLPPSFQSLTSYFDKVVSMITPSDDQRRVVEENTRPQVSCKRWKVERYLRLTASNFGRVMLRRSNHIKLADEILNSKLADTIPSLKWGRIHENDAFTEYLEQFVGKDETIRKAGFYIGKPSFLGASPDGVIEIDGKYHKIIEIKCPYSFRDLSLEEACSKGGFYCTMEDGMLHLKKDHLYYYQIQGTMAIVGAVKCDLIVWTSKSIKKETISFNKVLWENNMLPKYTF